MKTTLIRQNHNSLDLRQLGTMLDALTGFLYKTVDPDNQDWSTDFETVVAFQDDDGSFKLLDSYQVESDARVDFCYMPTYICTAIVMKAFMTDNSILAGRESVLRKALAACCARNLRGHGYDGLSRQIEALNIFRQGGVREFLMYHADFCPEFTSMIVPIITELQDSYNAGAVRGAWENDYTEDIRCLLDYFSKSVVFVYGTLMTGERNHDYYLKDRECLGKAYIKGFDMYDIGSFPGIVPGEGTVKGELYEITQDDFERLDRLEGEGSLYLRRCVPAVSESGEVVFAHIYKYNCEVLELEMIPDYMQPYTADWKSKRDRYV